MYADDTIAAIATPAGAGGVGIVRVSGPLAEHIAAATFACAKAPAEWDSHRMYHGRIVADSGAVLDDALAVLMRRPHSYTGEDVLELHCHGSPVVLRDLLARALDCGARLAEAGEFTKRAFLNGRLDLAQAEAVIDLVQARTSAGAALAAQQLCGRLSGGLWTLREDLIHVKSLLEAQIDFAEEDCAVDPDELLAVLDRCLAAVGKITDSYRHGKVMRDGLRVAIVGKPNVGKSSLLNALLGEERAIVTAIAGTTRDFIEESADFGGVPVVLSDTAGLRGVEHADGVERAGIERSAAKLAQAQMLLVVLDASTPLDAHDHAVLQAASGIQQIIVLNKLDLDPCLNPDQVEALANGHPVVAVSAREHMGINELRSCVAGCVARGLAADSNAPVLTNARHYDVLIKAGKSLALASQSIRAGRPADLVAVDVQDAMDFIGAVTGSLTSEDVLDRIFREFCVGK